MPQSKQAGANAGTAEVLRGALSGRYVVERELGRGGMASVYLARDSRHGRTVAIKVVQRDVIAPASGERFMREIQTTARLTHPHVLAVYDSGEADGLLYYVMPYVEGETLRERLSGASPMPLRDALRLMRELADALAYAHANGIVHRDLKPENVLLSGGHAVVADFGIAKAIAAATQGADEPVATLTGTGVSLGTPAYMAPEQVVGDRGIDHRADLYALGVLSYEMVAGGHPFGERSTQGLLAAHLTETAVPLATRRPDVPPALSALIAQLMAKDPVERPASAAAVVRALDAIGESTGTSKLRSSRWMIAGVTAVLFTVAIGTYAILRRSAANSSPSNLIRTLAVLPFVNTGGDANDDYFSDGLTDELAHALARLPGLRLAGRTSSYAFKGKTASTAEIGRALQVSALIEGTVRRAGDKLRVTTQLVGANDGKVLWDTLYESQSSDVFGVQDQFTRAVVTALRPSLGDGPADSSLADVGRGTTDQEAYELYLKGRYYWMARGPENVTRSIEYFKQAIVRDPTFARAQAGLALAYVVLPVYEPDPLDTVTALLAASADRAMTLDSTLADAQLALAASLEERLRFAEAEGHYRKAVALEPSNASAHHIFGMLLLERGRVDESIREINIAAQLDPLAKSAGSAEALSLTFGRRFPEAITAARRVLAIDPTFVLALQSMGAAFLFGGQPDSAVRAFERAEQIQYIPAQRPWLLMSYAAAGRWSDAARVRAQLHQPDGDLSGGVDAAFADYVFGDREPLIRLLMTDRGQRRWYNNHFGCNPLLDPLWGDARFRAAMHKLTIEPCPLAKPWPIVAGSVS